MRTLPALAPHPTLMTVSEMGNSKPPSHNGGPTSSLFYLPDCALGYAVLTGYVAIMATIRSNIAGVLRTYLSPASVVCAAFVAHILHVIVLRTDEEMFDVDARTNITFVANKLLSRQRSVLGHPCETVRWL